MKIRFLALLAFAACGSTESPPPEGPAPTPPTSGSTPTGFISAAQSPPLDAGPVVPSGGMVLPSIDAGGLWVVDIPNDGGLGCVAPAIEACPQIPLYQGYYYSPVRGGTGGPMYDQQGNAISKPLGPMCPAGNEYEIHCVGDPDAGTPDNIPWGKPADSLGCVEVGGWAGPFYCCPCP
jgi:hypothetical protein